MSNDFKALDFLQGRTYPTRDVKVYVDEVVSAELGPLLDVPENDRTAAQSKKIKELVKRAEDGALTFKLSGLPQHVLNDIYDTDDDSGTANSTRDDHLLLAASIRSISNAQGGVDERTFTPEEVAVIAGSLPMQAYRVLLSEVNTLAVSSMAYDRAMDAGFFPKS